MRNFSSVLLLLLLFAGFSFGQRQMMSPEDRTKQLKDSLALTDEQSASVLKIFQDVDVERKAIFESSGDDRGARRQAMRSLAEKTDAKIEALLTGDQKVKYGELKKRRQEWSGSIRRHE